MVGASSAQDSEVGVDSEAASFQGTALSSALAFLTGLIITAQDGVIPIPTKVTPTILTRLIRTPMLIRTHQTPTGMRTADRTRPPAHKQIENRFI